MLTFILLREAKKDLIDRHSPFIHCEKTAKATYVPGTLGNIKAHNTTIFTIIPTGKKLNLVAHGYCTKHVI
ncbi:superoxide reductase-like domain-containing protein [Malaciobacter molluscorum LMG 25693]|uniref:Superoxide reductase-like domain-containing protein n=1 Tax=Malaciobacter molluscorum LMG 25693 TaxID=870501 RepID=A0AB33GRG5_9BACT|nr:superoxide reductase-like domain-containing protein [Malaciobacter molluscorum LMG 25693]